MVIVLVACGNVFKGLVQPIEELGHDRRVGVHAAAREDLQVLIHEGLDTGPRALVAILQMLDAGRAINVKTHLSPPTASPALRATWRSPAQTFDRH